MGYERQAPAPSPLQILSIFDAKQRGMPMYEIAARTKYSISTLLRWWQRWGHEYSIFLRMIDANSPLLGENNFDTFYPDDFNAPAADGHIEAEDGSISVTGSVRDEDAETVPTQGANT